jgi:hypothetical protein
VRSRGLGRRDDGALSPRTASVASHTLCRLAKALLSPQKRGSPRKGSLMRAKPSRLAKVLVSPPWPYQHEPPYQHGGEEHTPSPRKGSVMTSLSALLSSVRARSALLSQLASCVISAVITCVIVRVVALSASKRSSNTSLLLRIRAPVSVPYLTAALTGA